MCKVAPAKHSGQQETGQTLYVGCDVGSDFHAVAFVDDQGKVLGSLGKVYNSRRGFEFLLKAIRQHAKEIEAARILLGFEPTGHYWKTLVNFVLSQGIEVAFIKTTAVKAMRELIDSTPSKNDERDAVTLAHLLRDGKTIKSRPPEGVWRELRDVVKHRQRLLENEKALLMRLRATIDTLFPELTGIFSTMKALGLWELLKAAPFPEDLLEKGEPWLACQLKQSTRRGKTAEERAKILFRAASESIGLAPRPADRVRIESTIRMLEYHRCELRIVEKEMERVLMQTGYGEILLSIPGIGLVTAATFLGELGNPEDFDKASEVVSFAGIDPSERSSGKKVSRRRISKKGRPVMRTALYFMALSAIRHCPELRAYYQARKHQIEAGNLDIAPQQLLFAVAIKEVRMIFAMCRDRTLYDSNKRPLLEQAA